MNLIEEVLKLDKEATAGWRKTTMEEAVDADGRCVLFDWRHHGADSDLILAYRTAAPKLARALQIALQPLRNFAAWEGDPMMRSGLVAPDRDDEARAVREILAEIEKELAP